MDPSGNTLHAPLMSINIKADKIKFDVILETRVVHVISELALILYL